MTTELIRIKNFIDTPGRASEAAAEKQRATRRVSMYDANVMKMNMLFSNVYTYEYYIWKQDYRARSHT